MQKLLWLAFVGALSLVGACDKAEDSGDEGAKEDEEASLAPPDVSGAVMIRTNAGVIKLNLFADKAPQTVANFVKYIEDGFYEKTVFHRVIPGFMIQAGGFKENLSKATPRTPIKNESSNRLSNKRGTVAMARTRSPDSATSQFFINVENNQRLDYKGHKNPGYTVFAEVVEGMEVVDRIAKSETLCPSATREPCDEKLPPGMRDVPKHAVIIETIELD